VWRSHPSKPSTQEELIGRRTGQARTEARQNPEEERLQILNSEIQELLEELAELEALEEAESDWKCYERPRVKNQIMVREDERTKLVNNYNSLIRRQLVAEKPKIELRRAQSRVRF
jgi:DNA repair exonuclease SbcCD nuclease subunit